MRDQLLALGCVGRPSRGGAECQPHEPPRSQSRGAEGAPAERGPSGTCVRARGRHFSWRGGSGGRRLCVDLHPGSSRPSPLGQARCPPVGEAIRRAGCSMDQRPEETAPPSPAPSPCALRLTPGPRSSDFCCLFRRGLGTEPRTERPGVSSLPLAAQGGGCPARGPLPSHLGNRLRSDLTGTPCVVSACRQDRALGTQPREHTPARLRTPARLAPNAGFALTHSPPSNTAMPPGALRRLSSWPPCHHPPACPRI